MAKPRRCGKGYRGGSEGVSGCVGEGAHFIDTVCWATVLGASTN